MQVKRAWLARPDLVGNKLRASFRESSLLRWRVLIFACRSSTGREDYQSKRARCSAGGPFARGLHDALVAGQMDSLRRFRERFCTIAAIGLLCGGLLLAVRANAQAPSLSSWNDGPAKQAIIAFVKQVTDHSSSKYVNPEDRIATFDQDGTLWVEHPLY